jgi:hypothetical protein
MSCKKSYMREHLLDMFPRTFIDGDLKKHREDMLFEREKCMLPETQAVLEREKEVVEINERIAELREMIYDLQFEHNNLLNGCNKTKKEFVRKCPGNDCNGFLSTQWKCGLCDTKVCKECLEVKEKGNEDAHVCDPNNLETAKLLAKDSKPCPACGAVIFKISGCSQMWCTQCHVAFDWDSGRIEKGVVHNPHYYEWQRSQNGGVAPRVPGDDPCGDGLVDVHVAMRSWSHLASATNLALSGFHQGFLHVRFVIMPRYPQNRDAADNDDIRRKYLKNEITQDKFKWLLHKREKSRMVKYEMRQIMDMFLTCGEEILRMTLNDKIKEKDAQVCLTELSALMTYTNGAIERVGKVYKVQLPTFYIINNRMHVE